MTPQISTFHAGLYPSLKMKTTAATLAIFITHPDDISPSEALQDVTAGISEGVRGLSVEVRASQVEDEEPAQ